MKTFLTILAASVLLLIVWIVAYLRADYYYEANVQSEWELADKSSTIPAKREHLDRFVATLERQNLQGRYDALIFPTPNNSFDANFAALKTLQSRLQEIEGMDVKSFEYQTAIQQITAQEQGEAQSMLKTFFGAWMLREHFLLWDWVGVSIVIFLSLAIIVAGFVVFTILIDG